MLNKLLLMVAVPVLLEFIFLIFGLPAGNILTAMQFPVEAVSALLNQMATMVSIMCTILDHFLIAGTAMWLVRFALVWEFYQVIYSIWHWALLQLRA